MAYFSNGSEGMLLDDECAGCLFAFDPCPIAFAQSFYNYEACNNEVASKILNCLVKQEDGKYIGCQMKPFIDGLKE